jgi:hypothetical protein
VPCDQRDGFLRPYSRLSRPVNPEHCGRNLLLNGSTFSSDYTHFYSSILKMVAIIFLKMLVIFCQPEDGNNFLQNVSNILPDYTAF